MGRKIKTLVDKIHSPGMYKIQLNSENLNSGVYLLKLFSSNNIFTKKITIVK